MYKFPVGVIVDSFRLPMAEAVKKAKEVGAQGIQVYATSGEMAPENLVGAKRKEFLDFSCYIYIIILLILESIFLYLYHHIIQNLYPYIVYN